MLSKIFDTFSTVELSSDLNCLTDLKTQQKRKKWLSYKQKKKHKYGEREERVRSLTEKLFYPLKFPSVRPDWLLNPETKKPMEIDLYCKELKLGLEVQGQQHYKYKENFHKTKENFLKMQQRDALKRVILKKVGIRLIEIPYYIPNDNLKEYILRQLASPGR